MKTLRVRSRRNEGFWRAKRQWPRAWTVATLSDDDAAAVLTEPHLEATEVTTEEAKGLPDVATVQPGPPAPYEPKPFTDPVLRQKQEERLAQDKAQGIEQQRQQAVRADLSDETLPREPIAKAEPPKQYSEPRREKSTGHEQHSRRGK